DASVNDPTLLDWRQTIGALDMIAEQQDARIDDGDGPSFRSKAVELLGRYQVEMGLEKGEPSLPLAALSDHLESGPARMRPRLDVLVLGRLRRGALLRRIRWWCRKGDPGQTIAVAGLVSRATDERFEASTGHYDVQRFQTLSRVRKDERQAA